MYEVADPIALSKIVSWNDVWW